MKKRTKAIAVFFSLIFLNIGAISCSLRKIDSQKGFDILSGIYLPVSQNKAFTSSHNFYYNSITEKYFPELKRIITEKDITETFSFYKNATGQGSADCYISDKLYSSAENFTFLSTRTSYAVVNDFGAGKFVRQNSRSRTGTARTDNTTLTKQALTDYAAIIKAVCEDNFYIDKLNAFFELYSPEGGGFDMMKDAKYYFLKGKHYAELKSTELINGTEQKKYIQLTFDTKNILTAEVKIKNYTEKSLTGERRDKISFSYASGPLSLSGINEYTLINN